MSTIKVTFDREFMPKMVKALQAEYRSMLDELASLAQTTIRKNLLARGIKNTGHLINSYQRSVSMAGNKGVAVVGSNSLYALPMEYGITKRFKPSLAMVESLKLWVRRKNIAGTAGKRSGKAKDAESSMAWAIAWKIAKKGLDPSRFPSYAVEDAFKETSARTAFVIERHIKRAFGLAERFA